MHEGLDAPFTQHFDPCEHRAFLGNAPIPGFCVGFAPRSVCTIAIRPGPVSCFLARAPIVLGRSAHISVFWSCCRGGERLASLLGCHKQSLLSATAPDLAPKQTNGDDVCVSRTRSGFAIPASIGYGRHGSRLLLEGQDAGDQAPMEQQLRSHSHHGRGRSIRSFVMASRHFIASQSDMRLVAEPRRAAKRSNSFARYRRISR